ncbi:MAG: 50S ribosomal protein L23, partial [Candidatus Diapherotrites archaeon]|nr:50S ribosomal protein L23 [Candidatus Diapherotrites archaeon]
MVDEKKKEKDKKRKIIEREDIILYPLISEKTTNMIEAENKLCFVVDDKANKAKIKEAVERAYNVKVTKVNVIR